MRRRRDGSAATTTSTPALSARTTWRQLVAAASTVVALLSPTAAATARSLVHSGHGAAYRVANVSTAGCALMSWPAVADSQYALAVGPLRRDAAAINSTTACGRCARVWCDDARCRKTNASTVVYVVGDTCTSCGPSSSLGSGRGGRDLHLAPLAFRQLTGFHAGRVAIQWRFVDCPRFSTRVDAPPSGVCLERHSNANWLGLQPVNDTLGVDRVAVDGRAARLLPSPSFFFSLADARGRFNLSRLEIAVTTRSQRTFRRVVAVPPGGCVSFRHSDEVVAPSAGAAAFRLIGRGSDAAGNGGSPPVATTSEPADGSGSSSSSSRRRDGGSGASGDAGDGETSGSSAVDGPPSDAGGGEGGGASSPPPGSSSWLDGDTTGGEEETPDAWITSGGESPSASPAVSPSGAPSPPSSLVEDTPSSSASPPPGAAHGLQPTSASTATPANGGTLISPSLRPATEPSGATPSLFADGASSSSVHTPASVQPAAISGTSGSAVSVSLSPPPPPLPPSPRSPPAIQTTTAQPLATTPTPMDKNRGRPTQEPADTGGFGSDADGRAATPPPLGTTAPPLMGSGSRAPPPKPTIGTSPAAALSRGVLTSPVFVGVLLGTVGLVGATVAYRAKSRQSQRLAMAPPATTASAAALTSRAAYVSAARELASL